MKMRGSEVRLRCARFMLLVALGPALACSEFGAGYFQNEVNKANQVNVAARYGAPHKIEKLQDGRTVWTYFDRGSGTSGYSGYARSSYCRAYILTFDQNEVLREWQEQDCATRPATITEPFSDRK